MAMETEQEAIARLKAAGYEREFVIEEEGVLRCPVCDEEVEPEDVTIDETVRFEGPSNPDDESVIFALSSGACGHKGILVSAFGPDVGGGQAEVLRRLGRPRKEPEGDPVTEREAAEQALIEEGDSEAGADLGDQID